MAHVCPKCGYENADQATECENCRRPLRPAGSITFFDWYTYNLPASLGRGYLRNATAAVGWLVLMIGIAFALAAIFGRRVEPGNQLTVAQASTPTPRPAPTDTPGPTPTLGPNDTKPGIVLALGRAWKAHGEELVLDHYDQGLGLFRPHFVFSNHTSQEIDLHLRRDDLKQIRAQDNLGVSYLYTGKGLFAEPADFQAAVRSGDQVDFIVALIRDPAASATAADSLEVTVTISLAGIQGARWQVPVHEQ